MLNKILNSHLKENREISFVNILKLYIINLVSFVMKGRFIIMKQKHLSFEERETIEDLLKEKLNLTQIAENIGKHRTTISKEILNHRFKKEAIQYNSYFANCIKIDICQRAGTKFCKNTCKDYIEKQCNVLKRPPYVCNGCNKKRCCRLSKYYYRAKDANNEYIQFRSESRIGIRISKEEIYEIDKIITPLIKDQNQSINHVFINHPDLLYFSKPTFYSYVNNNIFSFRNIDLHKKVSYKPRKDDKKRRTRTEAIIRIGRTYKDFNDYISLHPYASIVEMDTVEGVKGGKVLLTLLFRQYNFMLIFIMEHKTMEEVEKVFINIRKTIGNEEFKRIFEVILTDNGSEFFNPISIESDYKTGEVLSQVFYCDPSASYQKGSIEKNHEYIRYIIPKGHSFNHLTQDDCNLLASHINSTSRVILNNKTPYEAVQILINKDIIEKFNIKYITPDDINLSSSLLKKGNKND